MSDDVQELGPDEGIDAGRISPEDDMEGHGYRKNFTEDPEGPGPDRGIRPRIYTADDTDDVEGHKKHIR